MTISDQPRKLRPMPRSMGSEIGKLRRQPTRTPLHLKTTTSSDSSSHRGAVRDASLKVEDHHRRSPRSPLPEAGVVNQKKRGSTRVTDLQTRLGHAKEELKKLKQQIASAENAKRDAQLELEQTKKLIPTTTTPADANDGGVGGGGGGGEVVDVEEETKNPISQPEEEDRVVQEIPIPVNSMMDYGEQAKVDDAKTHVAKEEDQELHDSTKEVSTPKETKVASETMEKEEEEEEEEEVAEANVIATAPATSKSKVEEILGVVVERYGLENTELKKQLEEAKSEIIGRKGKEEELGLKVRSLTEEVERSKANSRHLEEQLESVETAKRQMEDEMRKLRVTTDQWKKAADAAADIVNCSNDGWKMGDRYVDEETMGNEKRKSAGIRMLGELWKKKGQQK